MMPHHIVVPLHKSGGYKGVNLELRYVLRSLERHFKGEYDLTVVGPWLPKWMHGARLLKTKKGLKFALNMAAEAYPDGFFWWYDDVVLLRDATPEELKVSFAKKGLKSSGTGWSAGLVKIGERLRSEGYEPWDYSHPHGPYWFDKGMVDEGFQDWPGMKGKFPWESWILSKRKWPSRRGPFRQYYGEFTSPPADGCWYVNFNSRGFSEKLRSWLEARFPEVSEWEDQERSPKVELIRHQQGSRKAISFSLYGDSARYSAGMVLNAMLAPEIYPGWEVVCHVERGHYSIDRLQSLGVRVIEHDSSPGQRGAAWRYETGDESARYDHVIFRDADSRLNPRERAAVEEWMTSGKSLHVMRDHPKHTTPILSGMFGIRTGCFSFTDMLKGWKGGREFGDGELLLAEKLWPAIKHDAVTHSYSPNGDELPFPSHSSWNGHVGQREIPALPGNVRLVLLSPKHYAIRREGFLKSLTENGGFLKRIELEWFIGTPIDQVTPPANFKRFNIQPHWWAATCDHIRIMEQSIARKDDWLLVFEDDVRFSPDFNESFWRAWAALPRGWKGMRMAWNSKWDNFKEGNPEIHKEVLHRCNSNGQGHYANLWNPEGLARFYDHAWHRRKMVIDEAFEDLRRKEPHNWYQTAKQICPVDAEAGQLGNGS